MIKESQFHLFTKKKMKDFEQIEFSYIKTSDLDYKSVKGDFEYLPQFEQIDKLKIKSDDTQIVFVSAKEIDTGLLAANYVAKKIEYGIQLVKNSVAPWQLIHDVPRFDFGSDFELVPSHKSKNSVAKTKNGVIQFDSDELPVIEEDEFKERYILSQQSMFNLSSTSKKEENVVYEMPQLAWYQDSSVIIVKLQSFKVEEWIDVLPYITQHIIFVYIGEQKSAQKLLTKMRYVMDVQYIDVGVVSQQYLKQLLADIFHRENVRFATDFRMDKFLILLAKQKKSRLHYVRDVQFIGNRLAQYAKQHSLRISNTLVEKLFDMSCEKGHSAQKIEQLAGLANAKQTLKKIAAKLEFNKIRELNNEPLIDQNNVLMFVGNPGTAKTTFAKLMGEYLVERGLLESNIFKAVTRKDLVGEYLGQTAPKVHALFQEVKGGVLFIDEAYSLYEKDGLRTYVDEAMAELVLCIEENPDTIVIFAGYPDEMKQFVDNANSGLKSRLTHVVYFDDYNTEEMFLIYKSFLEKVNLRMDKQKLHFQAIEQFLSQLSPMQLKYGGNGRLMRKVMQRAIEEKIVSDRNTKTVRIVDLNTAIKAILAEFNINPHIVKNGIGFNRSE